MKRFLVFLLAVMLVVSMGTGIYVDAAAAEGNHKRLVGLESSAEINIDGSYEAGEEEETVYRVTIDWGELNFKYDIGGSLTWRPASLTYSDTTHINWENDRTTISAINHSNRPVEVTATLKLAEAEKRHGLNASLATDTGEGVKVSLPAGMTGDKEGKTSTGTFTIIVGDDNEGKPDLTLNADTVVTVGTITLVVTAVDSPVG